jgi:hypothetical protein
MFDELELLRDTPVMQHLLAGYTDAAARDPEAWQERRMHVDGVEPRELVRWHGELLAAGWVELNVGQRGCGYRATAAGLRALKQVGQQPAVEDDGAPQVLVGSQIGPAPDSSSGNRSPGGPQRRKIRQAREPVISASSA